MHDGARKNKFILRYCQKSAFIDKTPKHDYNKSTKKEKCMDKEDITLYQGHDKFFKAVMQDKGAKEDFLNTYLPEELKADLDVEQVEAVDGKQISSKLQLQESDLLLKVKGKDSDVYILTLMEHKSYADRKTSFQILRYMLAIWESQLERKEELQPIVPIVIYEGKNKWEYPQIGKHFEKIPEKWQRFLPYYESLFYDFSMERALERLPENVYLKNYIQMIRLVYEPDKKKLIQELVEAFSMISDDEILIEIFRRAVLFVDYVKRNEWEESIVEVLKGEEIMPNVIELWEEQLMEKGRVEGRAEGRAEGEAVGIEKGRVEGRAEGRAEGKRSIAETMKNLGYSLEDIKKVTGLML
ncbi:Rpn family recombination-promoting nuclease/putative transposase [Clostridiales bacterium COT073_COT-073]|nr:Rpn family recombination-promoting nuclease/putative transposase [Clostridiales bacterium COT073_COT-073]